MAGVVRVPGTGVDPSLVRVWDESADEVGTLITPEDEKAAEDAVEAVEDEQAIEVQDEFGTALPPVPARPAPRSSRG